MNLFKKCIDLICAKGILYVLSKISFLMLSYCISAIVFPVFLILRVRILPVLYSALGHLAVELDIFLREERLGLHSGVRAILLAPQNVANRHLLQYWKRYVLVVENSLLASLLTPLGRVEAIVHNVHDSAVSINQRVAFLETQKRADVLSPLLSLTDLDCTRGREVLRILGVPDNTWYVCVHGRQNDDLAAQYLHGVRNVNIINYFLAIEAIVQRGGWVIRMGDKSMKPLPRMKNVVDYAHSVYKSEWMDIFLCGTCRFFLGSASGLIAVANVFGVPGVMANAAAPFATCLPYGSRDIGIPKLMWSLKDKRYLSFKEIFLSPLANLRLSSEFASYGVDIIENTPDEIRDVALEMHDRLEGKLRYFKEDEDRQVRFKDLMNDTHYSYGAMSRVGKDFLRKYEHLL